MQTGQDRHAQVRICVKCEIRQFTETQNLNPWTKYATSDGLDTTERHKSEIRAVDSNVLKMVEPRLSTGTSRFVWMWLIRNWGLSKVFFKIPFQSHVLSLALNLKFCKSKHFCSVSAVRIKWDPPVQIFLEQDAVPASLFLVQCHSGSTSMEYFWSSHSHSEILQMTMVYKRWNLQTQYIYVQLISMFVTSCTAVDKLRSKTSVETASMRCQLKSDTKPMLLKLTTCIGYWYGHNTAPFSSLENLLQQVKWSQCTFLHLVEQFMYRVKLLHTYHTKVLEVSLLNARIFARAVSHSNRFALPRKYRSQNQLGATVTWNVVGRSLIGPVCVHQSLHTELRLLGYCVLRTWTRRQQAPYKNKWTIRNETSDVGFFLQRTASV